MLVLSGQDHPTTSQSPLLCPPTTRKPPINRTQSMRPYLFRTLSPPVSQLNHHREIRLDPHRVSHLKFCFDPLYHILCPPPTNHPSHRYKYITGTLNIHRLAAPHSRYQTALFRYQQGRRITESPQQHTLHPKKTPTQEVTTTNQTLSTPNTAPLPCMEERV